MSVIVVAAIGRNNELGKDNGLIWKIPEDMKFFKKLTTGIPRDLAILLLSRHPEKINRNSKRCIHSRVHCSTVYNSQDMEAI